MKKALFGTAVFAMCVLFVYSQTAPSGSLEIEVSTDIGGELYFEGDWEATLGANATYTILVERQGTFSLRLIFPNGLEKATSVTVSSQGTTRVNFAEISSGHGIGSRGPAGGIVFYDKGVVSDGWRYLEMVPNMGVMGSRIPRLLWGVDVVTLTLDSARLQESLRFNDIAGTGTAVGTGRRNTELIVARLTERQAALVPERLRHIDLTYAALVCTRVNYGGFRDWFLPSRDELNLMYQFMNESGRGDDFPRHFEYWSSSQSDAGNAWVQHFSNGRQRAANKFENPGFNITVRAIRAF